MANVLTMQEYLFNRIYKLLDNLDSTLNGMDDDSEEDQSQENSVIKSKGKLVRLAHPEVKDI